MKLYHGSSTEIELQSGRCMYFSTSIDDAKQYALGLDDCGNYNKESFIYEIEINEDEAVLIDDWMDFDSIGYVDYKNMPEVSYNDEMDYYCLKNVSFLKLILNYKN